MDPSAGIGFSREKSWDFPIYVVLVLIAAASFLALWHPELLGISRQSGLSSNSVGQLWREEGQVRRKESGSVVWHDLFRSKTSVGVGDMVFTGSDGKARISFDNGLRAALDPDSMMVIQQDARAFESGWLSAIRRSHDTQASIFQLKRGAIRIENAEANRPVLIEAQGKTYRLDSIQGNGEMNIRLDDTGSGQKLEISTLPQAKVRITEVGNSKAAPIDISGKQTALLALPKEPGTSASGSTSSLVDPGSPIWNLPTLRIPPVQASTRISAERGLHAIPVRIRWEPIDGATGYEIRVFHGASPFLERELKMPGLDFELTRLDGEPYSYQITVALKTGERIQTEKSPVLLVFASPVVKVSVRKTRGRAGHKALITWSRTALTPRYRIEIAKDPHFTHLVLDRETPLNLFVFSVRSVRSVRITGVRYVRVKSLTESHESGWSETKRFEV